MLMSQRNLSAAKLSKAIGVSPKTVLEWMDKGGRMPRSADHIRKLASYFGVSIHMLMFGEEDPRSTISDILDKTEIHTGLYEITIKKVKRHEGTRTDRKGDV